MPTSILLIAPEAATQPIADDLRRDLAAEVATSPNRRSAIAALRRQDFDLVLVDEALAATDPTSADLIYQTAAAALIVDVNFAISSSARVTRIVRAALTRRSHDRTQSRAAATAALHHELNAALSGILLEAQLALREASPEQQPRLEHLVRLSTNLRDLLRS
ncbi:MAG: hypothetical protein HIU91_08490 [Acidobacteria bacterium]|nr:hypothetical protein [Acidobacteriota bacterium]